MLELASHKLGNAEVVAARGRLDSATTCLFEAHCRNLVCAGGSTVVFDFQDLCFLSSAGLRAILGLAKRIRAEGGRVVFTGIRGSIRDMFSIAGFLEAFPVVDQVRPDIA